jgi:hypothetical protein
VNIECVDLSVVVFFLIRVQDKTIYVYNYISYTSYMSILTLSGVHRYLGQNHYLLTTFRNHLFTSCKVNLPQTQVTVAYFGYHVLDPLLYFQNKIMWFSSHLTMSVLCGFPVIWLWVYPMQVILETCHEH